MYIPPHFAESDDAVAQRLIHDHPLAAVIASTAGGLVANHLPLIRQGAVLIGHCALANPMHQLIASEDPVMALFQGPEGYVSPNWYPSKAETHKAVPTWNYGVVHVHGRLTFSHAERDKRRAVSLLTAKHETLTNGAGAWRMGDAPADFLQTMLDGIVAFQLTIERIEAKSKLNQNRSAEDRQAVAKALDGRDATELARAMRGADGG